MKKIVTIGGSSSKHSINKQLAEYTGQLLEQVQLVAVDLNAFEMPLFSVDIEKESGFPEGAKALNELIESADGFVISLAEHNGAYSAAFKNAFDWLSRIESKVWRNKPMLVLATSPGARGGQSVLDLALSRFPYNGGRIVGHMAFPSFSNNFSDGEVSNTELRSRLIELSKVLKQEL